MENLITKEAFTKSLQKLERLVTEYKVVGEALVKRKKRAPLRVLEAILFDYQGDDLIGKEERDFLDICRSIIYHKQVVEIYLNQDESNKEELKELINE